MLVFFDETFREFPKRKGITLGALCGIAIPEKDLSRIAWDVYQLKSKHFGSEKAKVMEAKGKELFKKWVFRLAAKGEISRNLSFASDLLNYIEAKGLKVFGCVCFEKGIQEFCCADVTALDTTFRYIFERVDMFMKIKHPDRMAKLIFDDRDYRTNQKNAEAITNFFQRSAWGLSLDSIIKTPFFAISQSQNVGLQLADFITTIIGLRFAGSEHIKPYFAQMKKSVFSYKNDAGMWISGLKVIRGGKKAPGDLAVHGRDKKAQLPAQD